MKKTKVIEQKILDKMKERGYTLMSYKADGSKADFANANHNGISATVYVKEYKTTAVLWAIFGLIIVKTVEFDFYHPRFTSLFENKILTAISQIAI